MNKKDAYDERFGKPRTHVVDIVEFLDFLDNVIETCDKDLEDTDDNKEEVK